MKKSETKDVGIDTVIDRLLALGTGPIDLKKFSEVSECFDVILQYKMGLASSQKAGRFVRKCLDWIEENRLDDFISNTNSANEKDMSRRWKSLAPIVLAKAKQPPEKLKKYLIEASWAYIHDLPLSCRSLCRSVLEIAIKDVLGKEISFRYKEYTCKGLMREERRMKKENIRFDSLQHLINKDWKRGERCDEWAIEAANCIRLKGNMAVHNAARQVVEIDEEKETLKVLRMTRELLGYLYS